MFLQHPKSISILDKEQKKHQASPFAFMRALADNLFVFRLQFASLKKSLQLCAVSILRDYWKQRVFNDDLQLYIYIFIFTQLVEVSNHYQRPSYGVRALGGLYVYEGRGGLGCQVWARIFFPNLILWLIFPYFYFGNARSKQFATLRNVSKLTSLG